MLIPDEFQVEDQLWEDVQRVFPAATFDRDRPQRLVASWCEANGVPMLDLLPLFRAQPVQESGRRELYILRDSHWNARGNELAGHALGRFVQEMLEGG